MDSGNSETVPDLPKPPRRNGKRTNSVTTPEHEATFGKYLEEWQTALNLLDWRVEHGKQAADTGAMAQVSISIEDRLAVWFLGKSFGPTEVTEEAIERTAIHEMLHVRLAEFKEACVARDAQRIEQIEHGLITVFERLLYRGKHKG